MKECAMWVLVVLLFVCVILSMFALNSAILKRNRLETVIAKLREKETLNEQEIELYMWAKKFNWLTGELSA